MHYRRGELRYLIGSQSMLNPHFGGSDLVMWLKLYLLPYVYWKMLKNTYETIKTSILSRH